MATLSVQKLSLSGITLTFSACDAAGDEFENSGEAFIYVKNSDTVDHTVIVNSQQPCSYGFDHDVSVTVPTGGEKLIGTFPKDRFNDSNGKVQISYDAVTGLTIAVVEV
jgi:hypothetical protein